MFGKLAQKLQNLGGGDKEVPELISYKQLRTIIGVLGMSLSIILFLGGIFLGDTELFQPSISHYYYTNMREIFVGTMCSVAIFLYCYKGNNWLDGVITNIAATAAILVALFPTDLTRNEQGIFKQGQADLVSVYAFQYDKDIVENNIAYYNHTPGVTLDERSTIHETIHTWCAVLFFLSLAYIAGILFTKSKLSWNQLGMRKKLRNVTYITCAVIMILCMAFIIVGRSLLKASEEAPIIFWGEAIALFAFGTSWLVKGLGDTNLTDPIKLDPAQMLPISTVHSLALNEARKFVIEANDKFSVDCLGVSANQEYEISWDDDQEWYDLGVRSGPRGYYNPFAVAKGMRIDTPCFRLCASYNWDDNTGIAIGDIRTGSKTIMIPKSVTPQSCLSFFANDAREYYYNNSGSIEITIKRKK